MDFDIVIATRNRRLALQHSIPLMLSQSRLPRKLIVVDASDDFAGDEEVIREIFGRYQSSCALEIHATDPGLAIQRNFSLSRVVSPIVFFPDDDAIWFSGFAEGIMSVYERDTCNSIAGVCGAEKGEPPAAFFAEEKPRYTVAKRDRSRFVAPIFKAFERRFLRDPLFETGSEKIGTRIAPDWLSEENAELCEQMTGFRMTFRTEAIRSIGFDEALGKYALFEDYDASFGVLNLGLLALARSANVYHYRSPEMRTAGFEWGAIHILNRAYVVCKSSGPQSSARRHLIRYSRYKVFRYLLQTNSKYGRRRLAGAIRALAYIPALLQAPRDQLRAEYLKARHLCREHTN